MSNHVTEWLNAYFDGELSGRKLQQVEEHLTTCEACQAELESLSGLSSLLHEVPTPEFTQVERFASQVSLRLPHARTVAPEKKIIELGWWMIPVGLLAVWVFVSTAFIVSDIVSTASNFGLLNGIAGWLGSDSSNGIYLSATLGQAGVLSNNSLNLAETAERFTRTSLPQIGLQIAIGLLYLSWMAIWWARHTRQGSNQLIEG
jgi:hypothetical protein